MSVYPKPRISIFIALLCLLLSFASAAQPGQRTAAAEVFAPSVVTEKGSKLFLPTERNGLLPVVILLPFTGSNAQRLLDWYYSDSLLQQADQLGFAVLLPAAAGSRNDYASGSNWSATMNRYQQDLAADVDDLVRQHGADPKRIILAGYSMGGDLAWATIQRDPQRYAGAIVMGSRASYRDQAALEKLAAREVRMVMFMGASESPSRLNGMQGAIAALETAGVEHQYLRAPGGHVPAPPEQLIEAIRYVLQY